MRINEDFIDNIGSSEVSVSQSQELDVQPDYSDWTMYRMFVTVRLPWNYKTRNKDKYILIISKLFRMFETQNLFPTVPIEVNQQMRVGNRGAQSEHIVGENNPRALIKELRNNIRLINVSQYYTYYSRGFSDLTLEEYRKRWRRIEKCLDEITSVNYECSVEITNSGEFCEEHIYDTTQHISFDVFVQDVFESINYWQEEE